MCRFALAIHTRTKFSVRVGSHKLNMQPESRRAISALPFLRFAQIHIKLRYVFGVWHLHTLSVVEMRVSLLNINVGPDARWPLAFILTCSSRCEPSRPHWHPGGALNLWII